MEQFVEFKLGEENFCIDIDKVTYIEKFQNITHVPQVPKYIEGIISIHDEITAVYNLHQKFGLKQVNVTDNSTLIVVNINDVEVAFIVDNVYQIIDNKEYEMDPTPKMISNTNKYISGILKAENRLIMILNVEEIVDKQEQKSINDMLNTQKQNL